VDNVNGGRSYDFQGDFENLKSWFDARFKWPDKMLAVPDAHIDESTNTRSTKLSTSVALDGMPLRYCLFDLYGVHADHVISPSATGQLQVILFNTHTTAKSCALYLNGTRLIGESPINTNERVKFTFDVSELDLTEGAINVLYMPTFRSDGTLRSMTSLLIRVSEYAERGTAGRTVRCGDEIYFLERGAEITLPEITETREGFVAEGWTDGKDLYRPGESVRITESFSFYIRWKRIDIFSSMKMY
jgi:hypothetical protein